MKYSPQQQAFIDWCKSGTGSCILEAVAGSGKTTTILASVMRIRGNSAILAYNKRITEEIKAKLIKMGVDWKKANAGTVHSFGFKAYMKAFPGVTVEKDKVHNIIDDLISRKEVPKHLENAGSSLSKAVSIAKQRAFGILCGIEARDKWLDAIDHFDILPFDNDSDFLEDFVTLAIRVLKISNSHTRVIDFDDMVYMPLIHKVQFWRFDNVYVDEAQDTNPARRALVRALVKPGGRVIAVGDRHQAIYGFTGADADSLDLIARDFNAIRMPLTVTYRCPKKIVEFARQWVKHIEAHETAPEGSVSRIAFAEFIKLNDLDADSAVLCRNTAPLVTAAFALIRAKKACRIEGREIGIGLKQLAQRWKKATTIDELLKRLEIHLEQEKTKLLAKKREMQAQIVEDQVETLRVICDECLYENKQNVSDVTNFIDDLFADNVNGVLVLSTIHKSKGREWKRVFWMDRAGTCPSKYARQKWQIGQERNLMYVAATRAMSSLVELSAPPEKEKSSKPFTSS